MILIPALVSLAVARVDDARGIWPRRERVGPCFGIEWDELSTGGKAGFIVIFAAMLLIVIVLLACCLIGRHERRHGKCC